MHARSEIHSTSQLIELDMITCSRNLNNLCQKSGCDSHQYYKNLGEHKSVLALWGPKLGEPWLLWRHGSRVPGGTL